MERFSEALEQIIFKAAFNFQTFLTIRCTKKKSGIVTQATNISMYMFM